MIGPVLVHSRFGDISLASVRIERLRWHSPAAAEIRPGWLSRSEWLEGESISHPDRRWQWLAGRRAVKSLLVDLLCEPSSRQTALGRITLRSRDRLGRPMAPRAWLDNRPLSLSCSISHTSTHAAAAVSASCRPGIDLLSRNREPLPGHLGIGLLHWSLIEAAFKTGVTLAGFQPLLWQVFRCSRQTYSVRAPNRSEVEGRLLCLDGKRIALCWREGEPAS